LCSSNSILTFKRLISSAMVLTSLPGPSPNKGRIYING
jgi:hypothetical protein